MSSASMPPGPPPVPPPPKPLGPASSDSKNLVPILVVIGVLLCGCIAVPLLGGGAMLMYFSTARRAQNARMEDAVEQLESVDMRGGDAFGPGSGLAPSPPGVPGFGGGLGIPASGDSKELARLNMEAAEQSLNVARAQYEAMQGVYEQQRDFQAQQAGRLGAQGIRLPPPQPPDPQLYQNVQAAEAQYEAAKAAYEAAQ